VTDSGPRKLLIDTDPGIDDAMAIFYALESPELEVVGLTTVFGNADTDVTTRNALSLLEIAQRSDIPVAAGAVKPLAMDYRGPAAFVHGLDGQGGVELPAPATAALATDAAHFIIDTVMSSPGQITLVPLGPLTNVALAMLVEPRLTQHVAEIVLMGGAAFVGGNASPAAEANMLNDPEAADIVFGADCPIVMAGLDVTEQTFMTGDDLRRIANIDTPPARHLSAIVPYYANFFAQRLGIDGIHVHDSSPALHVGRPPDPRRLRAQLLSGQDAARPTGQRPRSALAGSATGPNPHRRGCSRRCRARARTTRRRMIGTLTPSVPQAAFSVVIPRRPPSAPPPRLDRSSGRTGDRGQGGGDHSISRMASSHSRTGAVLRRDAERPVCRRPERRNVRSGRHVGRAGGRGPDVPLLLCGHPRRTRGRCQRVGLAREAAPSAAGRRELLRGGRIFQHPVDRHHLRGAVGHLLHCGRSSKGTVGHPIFERVDGRWPQTG
jgi:inosine-uridine nucleoside N-ribohydrolase